MNATPNPNSTIPENLAAPASVVVHAHQNAPGALHGRYDVPGSSNKLAFADEEFLLRPETRGIRMQLEMLKPDVIMKEQGIEHTIVVFGSARYVSPERAASQRAIAVTEEEIRLADRAIANSVHYQRAYEFGQIVARRNLTLPVKDRLTICTGGGPGIMEAANRGAFELGDKSVGMNIALPFEQEPNPYITPELCFQFHYFSLRKMSMIQRSIALVCCPGGWGSMDEMFEILTLTQTGKIQPMPIVLLGREFWTKLINFQMFVDEGVIGERDMDLLAIVDTPEEAWDHIKKFYHLAV